jgi:hypothetical protein
MEPKLELIALSSIQPQEKADVGRVKNLISGMEKSGILRDPPIVARGPRGSLIQLDGTTRLMALKELGCTHTVAQIVDYNDSSQVLIKSWVHVSKVDRKKFLKELKSIKNVSTEEFKLGLGLTLTGHPLAVTSIIFRDGRGLSVIGSYDLFKRVRLMQRVVDLYSKFITRNREVSIESMAELKEFFENHQDKNVALFFPSFSAQEIFALLKKGITLPQGITRHIVNGRLLRINYPLEMLKNGTGVGKKKAFFKSFTEELTVRFYEESTFVVD